MPERARKKFVEKSDKIRREREQQIIDYVEPYLEKSKDLKLKTWIDRFLWSRMLFKRLEHT